MSRSLPRQCSSGISKNSITLSLWPRSRKAGTKSGSFYVAWERARSYWDTTIHSEALSGSCGLNYCSLDHQKYSGCEYKSLLQNVLHLDVQEAACVGLNLKCGPSPIICACEDPTPSPTVRARPKMGYAFKRVLPSSSSSSKVSTSSIAPSRSVPRP